LDELTAIASSLKLDFIALCETWLTASVSDEEIHLPGYSSFRCDRDDGRRGGGVCVYVNNCLQCEDISHSYCVPAGIESVAVIMSSMQILLVVIYIPPNVTVTQHEAVNDYLVELFDSTSSSSPDLKLIVAGDLNQFPTKTLEGHLDLVQIIETPTRGTAVLDKILLDKRLVSSVNSALKPHNECTRTNEKKELYTVAPEIGNSDHRSILLNSFKGSKVNNSKIVKVCDYRESNMDAFRARLRAFPWSNFYRADLPVDEKCDLLHEVIDNARLSTFPVSYVSLSKNDKPWITPVIKSLINKRFEAYRTKDFKLFHHYKEKVRTAISQAKRNWTKTNLTKENGLWKITSNFFNKSKSNTLMALVSSFESFEKAANTINGKFGESFTKAPNWDIIVPNLNKNKQLWSPDIDIHEIYRLLLHLKVTKSAGSDNLTPRLLKETALELAEPLAHIIALSFETYTVPHKWKFAKVVPIPKRRNPKIEDLRPISMLPIFSKIMEKIALHSIKKALIEMYGPSQFGFRPHYSTTHAHISIHDSVSKALNDKQNKGAVIISFDMQKAFDSLDHGSLMKSLANGGLPSGFLFWCLSYLQDRRQVVSIGQSVHSTSIAVTSGIPQGSVISPYLFSAHMGSLEALHPYTCITKYADDVVAVIPVKDSSDIERRVASEINHVQSWCNAHGLNLNTRKTHTILVTRSKYSLIPPASFVQAPSLKILGISYTADLKWNTHIDGIIKKASQRIFVLKNLKSFLDKKDLTKIYNALILSVLEYGAPVMVGMVAKNARKLERVRRRCHRIICGPDCKCEALPPLTERRVERAVKLFKSFTHDTNILHPLIPNKLPRTQKYFIEPITTDVRLRSFIPHMSLHINQL
jgi:hypothetical protein